MLTTPQYNVLSAAIREYPNHTRGQLQLWGVHPKTIEILARQNFIEELYYVIDDVKRSNMEETKNTCIQDAYNLLYNGLDNWEEASRKLIRATYLRDELNKITWYVTKAGESAVAEHERGVANGTKGR